MAVADICRRKAHPATEETGEARAGGETAGPGDLPDGQSRSGEKPTGPPGLETVEILARAMQAVLLEDLNEYGGRTRDFGRKSLDRGRAVKEVGVESFDGFVEENVAVDRKRDQDALHHEMQVAEKREVRGLAPSRPLVEKILEIRQIVFREGILAHEAVPETQTQEKLLVLRPDDDAAAQGIGFFETDNGDEAVGESDDELPPMQHERFAIAELETEGALRTPEEVGTLEVDVRDKFHGGTVDAAKRHDGRTGLLVKISDLGIALTPIEF